MQRDTSLGYPSQKPRRPFCCNISVPYCTDKTMLDSEKISLGRVREGYGLTGNEIEKIILALWPDNLFPVELWRRAHETYWRGFADSNQAVYKIESPALPEVDLSVKYFHAHLCALDMMAFFRKLSLNIQASTLREGLHFILEESYENIDAIFPEEREFLLSTLARLETTDVFEQYSQSSELFEEKILMLSISSYHFISQIFSDSILVDKVAVIRFLRNYPLLREVKGITHALVKEILDSTPYADISISQPQVQDTAPPSTGSRKDIERITATTEVCEELVKELLQESQTFENDKSAWKPSLLNHVIGKTNWVTFFKAATARLGDRPHRAAAREVWEKVPVELKHPGRMPEQ